MATQVKPPPALRSSGAKNGAHAMLGVQLDASQNDLKAAFLRAVTPHAKPQGGIGPIDMQRFIRFEKAYERCLEQHFQGKGGGPPPKQAEWITLPALLLQLLRELGPEEWAETLAAASERCLSDSMEIVTRGKDTLSRVLPGT